MQRHSLNSNCRLTTTTPEAALGAGGLRTSHSQHKLRDHPAWPTARAAAAAGGAASRLEHMYRTGTCMRTASLQQKKTRARARIPAHDRENPQIRPRGEHGTPWWAALTQALRSGIANPLVCCGMDGLDRQSLRMLETPPRPSINLWTGK